MPSIFSHFAILDNIVRNYPISAKARQVLTANPNYGYWGSVGPDFLFFYPADWNPVIKTFLEFYYVYDDLTQEAIEIFDSTKEIYSATDQQLKDMLTGGVYGELQSTLSGFVTIFTAKMADFLTSQFDMFEIVKPPIFDKYTESQRKDWWWMDIGHHVRPMDFMRSLWKNAGSNERFQAYAYGYMSHIGSDVIGHAYVNAIVGGPYRNHWRRHALVEKCLDTYLWDYFYKGSVSDSQAYKLIHFENPPYNFPLLPEDLAEYTSKSFADTYADLGINSGTPDSDSIRLMYSYFYRWTKSASSKSLLNLPPPPPEFDWWDLPDDIRNVLDSIKPPPAVTEPPLNDLTDVVAWKKFFRSLFKFISWVLETIVMVISFPVYVLMRVLTTPVRYLIWLLQKLIYELYESSRIALALGALVHPEKKHLDIYFKNIISPNPKQVLEQYPFERTFNQLQTYHLVHPFDFNPFHPVESTPTRPFFNLEQFVPEKYFLGQLNLSDLSGFETACQRANANTLESFASENKISASDFSFGLFRQFEINGGKDLPNWNLDVDRGLGWTEWFGNIPKPWNAFTDFKFPSC